MIFGWEKSDENNSITKKLNQIRYFNITNIGERWCKIGCTSEGSVIHQISAEFLVATFYQLALFGSGRTCLCNVLKSRIYVNANISFFLILNNGHFYLQYYAVRHRNSLSKRCSLVSIVTPIFSTFIHQNNKSTISLNIYSILEKHPKAVLKMFLIDVDRLTLLRRPQDVIFEYSFKMHLYIVVFFNIDYR